MTIFKFYFENWITNINSWWCNDLSILLTIVGFIASISWNVYGFYKSRQVKLNVIGDISPINSSEIQITVSNVGIVNARLGKIGIGFHCSEKWFKPKSGGIFETSYSHESLKFDPILAAGETIRIYMDLSKVKKSLEHLSLDDYNRKALVIGKFFGWIYLSRNKLSNIDIKNSDDRIREIEDDLNDHNIKQFSINFSAALISILTNHVDQYCKNHT